MEVSAVFNFFVIHLSDIETFKYDYHNGVTIQFELNLFSLSEGIHQVISASGQYDITITPYRRMSVSLPAD